MGKKWEFVGALPFSRRVLKLNRQYDGTRDHRVRNFSVLLAPILTAECRRAEFQVQMLTIVLRLDDFLDRYCFVFFFQINLKCELIFLV